VDKLADSRTEFQKFDTVVRKLITVPHKELKARERKYKEQRAKKKRAKA
jgi:hypothetical protein